jgi:ABC-type multidrug transport system fused ATPase/permease subunit
MPLAAILFICLVVIDRYQLSPSIIRLKSTIKKWIIHRLGMHSRRSYLNSSAYNSATEKEINNSILALADISKVSVMMLAFLGDIVSISITILAFVFLAGSHYIPLLLVFLVYIFSELLRVSKNSNLSFPINSLPGSILESFYANQREWILGSLAPMASAQACKYHTDLQVKQLKSKDSLGSMKVVDAAVNAIVMIALTILGLYLNSTSNEVAGGGFLAGLLVIFRLITLSKSCARNFYTSRALYQRSSKRIFPSLHSIVNAIKNDVIAAQPNYDGLSRELDRTRVDIRRVSITYRNSVTNELQDVLKNVDLVVDNQTKVVIYADRNEGLSTLADCVTGIAKPNRGRVMINGMDTRFNNSNWNNNGIYVIGKTVLNHIADPRYSSNYQASIFSISEALYNGSVEKWRSSIQESILAASSPILIIDRPEQFTDQEKCVLDSAGVYDKKNTVITLTQRKELLKTSHQSYLLYRGVLKKLSI